MNSKTKVVFAIIGGFLLYLFSTAVSWASFRYLNKPGVEKVVSPLTGKKTAQIDLSAPKTEACPLNGKMFTKAERKIWEKRRPLGVMIENHQQARPQSGLGEADIVYEAVAEGGITRFLAIFYCGASRQAVTVGPVRSARTYFLDFVSEYGDYPLYAHVGGANKSGPANALGQIGDYGWLRKGNDLNQFSLGFPVYWRDYERLGHSVATEHTMYSTTEKLWDVAHKRDLDAEGSDGTRWDENFKPWRFKDDKPLERRGEVAKIKLSFWSGHPEYAVEWDYDKQNNIYSRFNGGQPHKDLDTKQQLQAKTVVVLSMREKGPIDELKHLLYTTIGRGKLVVFQDGEAIKGQWQKKSRQSRMKFLNARGKEIVLDRGPIWIEVIPARQKIDY